MRRITGSHLHTAEGGHEAYSCDLLPTSGNHPEWHIQADALEVAKMNWDMVLAFPPCTHLAVSGARWFSEKTRNGKQQMGVGFFLAFTALDHVPHVAIENPVGIMSRIYREPDQIIHPWMFGDPYHKKTCLWLKNLPKLVPTCDVESDDYVTLGDGKRYSTFHDGGAGDHATRGQRRSKTFPGIAKAMANQWSDAALAGYVDQKQLTLGGGQ